MTRTAEEADELVRLSRRSKVPLQIGHIERFNAAVGMLRQLKEKPRFIEALRQGPFDGRIKDVGVVQDLMIHDLDIILELLEHSPVTKMEAVGVNVITPFEDIANVRLHFENGCVANVTASRISMERVRKIRVFQRSSYLSIDYMNQKVAMLRLKEGMTLNVTNFREAIVREQVPIQTKEPLRMELLSFIQCVREKLEPAVPPEHGYAALKLALDITEEVRKNMGSIRG
jgi:predicted dehydrogenase